MPSPFPGMNPYLEQESAWEDFHPRFITRSAEVLSAQVRPRYFAKIEERLYVHEPDVEGRRFVGRSDVSMTPGSSTTSAGPAAELLQAPAHVRVPILDVERSSYLQIRDRVNREVVTVIELLSPTKKKPGTDRAQYESKRNLVLWSSTNLVEIDLLRGHPRMPMAEAPKSDYCVLVCRPEEWPRAGFWPISLHDRLPVIPVPLRPGEPNVTIDLQELLHRLYDVAGYGLYIYEGTPDPPLSRADARWARQFLPRTGGPVKPPQRKKKKSSS
jgi:hypothetical protein